MGEIKFWLDQAGVNDVILMKNAKIDSLEREIMMRTLDEVRANFIQDFGFQGEFTVSYEPTKVRSRFKIKAANSRTGAVLKAHPGWLGRFSQGAKL